MVHIAPWTRESNPGKRDDIVSFFDVTARDGARPTITHLKQGGFYQRTSGQMDKRQLNIPFAWGFMADRTKIWAALQLFFYSSQQHVRPRAGLVNVAAHFGLARKELQRPMSYPRAKEVFGARESLTGRRYPVPGSRIPPMTGSGRTRKYTSHTTTFAGTWKRRPHAVLIIGGQGFPRPASPPMWYHRATLSTLVHRM